MKGDIIVLLIYNQWNEEVDINQQRLNPHYLYKYQQYSNLFENYKINVIEQ
ncbi:hypothetical protein pb186bvf_017873 [Paramecium bursaria]